MQRILSFPVLSLVILGCGETAAPTASAGSAPAFPTVALSSAPDVTTGPFFAVANCAADIGFDIRFGGERVLSSHTTVDASGREHTTLHFRVHDFLGWKLPEDVFTEATADYDVQGGAEMFAIEEDAAGDLVLRIHHGNLVFGSLSDDSRVVAHHTIHEVPGQDPVNSWSCWMSGLN